MAAQVFAFKPRRGLASDWTQDELAELYRIEHVLFRSGLTVEHDRGQTEEGDPWFVFCRSDGEVLIHLTRYDGLYRLYSPALPAPLIGRNFSELTKSFADQMPLNVVVQRGKGAQLLVHPASMLALIIGTIFLAAQDLLPPETSPDAIKKGGDGEAFAVHPLRASLQAAFQTHFDAFVAWARDGISVQHLASIGLITAVLSGLTDALTHDPQLVDSAAQPHDFMAATQQATVDFSDSRYEPVGPQSVEFFSKMAGPLTGQVANTEATPVAGQDHLPTAQLSAQLTTNIGLMERELRIINEAKASEAAKSSDLLVFAIEPFFQEQNSIQLTWPVLLKPTESVIAYSVSLPTNSAVSSSNSTAVNDLLTSLNGIVNSGRPLSSFTEISNLLAHATVIDPAKSDWAFLIHSNLGLPQTVEATAIPAGPVATFFDEQATISLESFLTNNPHAQAIFDDHRVIIYQTDPSSHVLDTILNVWKFADGSTITLVGTSNPHALLI